LTARTGSSGGAGLEHAASSRAAPSTTTPESRDTMQDEGDNRSGMANFKGVDRY
jgi:hypothetical protein